MVGGKGNRSNCKTWILAPREPLCARPVARDGNDFGKFNTRPAHKQKTRKINLGRWEEAESQAVDFCSAGKEPVPGSGSRARRLPGPHLGRLGPRRRAPGTGHRAGRPRAAGGSSQGCRAGGEAAGSRGRAGTAGVPAPPDGSRDGGSAGAHRGAPRGRADCLVPFHVEAVKAWLLWWQGRDDNWNRKEKKFFCQPPPGARWCVVQPDLSCKPSQLCNVPEQLLVSAWPPWR